MFIKTVLALLVTMALAAAAVFFGAHQNIDLNETKLRPNTRQSDNNNTLKDSPNFLERFTKGQRAETQRPSPKMVQERIIVEPEGIRKLSPSELENTYSILLEQAENISMPNLKDQAYVDIIDYALRYGLFANAENTMTKINHIELRDTSRGHVGIALARAGKIEDAFKLIDQVETDGLRDVLRLQVIEAITLPSNFEPQIIQRLPSE